MADQQCQVNEHKSNEFQLKNHFNKHVYKRIQRSKLANVWKPIITKHITYNLSLE
jgi:hypothetical protein